MAPGLTHTGQYTRPTGASSSLWMSTPAPRAVGRGSSNALFGRSTCLSWSQSLVSFLITIKIKSLRYLEICLAVMHLVICGSSYLGISGRPLDGSCKTSWSFIFLIVWISDWFLPNSQQFNINWNGFVFFYPFSVEFTSVPSTVFFSCQNHIGCQAVQF